jgi:hypothetical protein
MTVDEIISVFPAVTSVVGETWLRRKQSWAEEYISDRLKWYEQLETDLGKIEPQVGRQSLTKCYRSLLRDKKSTWTTLYEIHGISLLAEISSKLELHVARGDSSSKNFDARANIKETPVNVECKTRKDEFPFNLPATLEGPERIPVHSGSRATLDPHDAAHFGLAFDYPEDDRLFRPIPASIEVRQTLLEGLAQLPASGCNLILLGELGFRADIEKALFGAEIFHFKAHIAARTVDAVRTRVPTGAFCSGLAGEPFRQLSAVLCFQLFSLHDPEYKLYLNPNATSQLPDVVVTSLRNVIGSPASSDGDSP